MPENDEKAFEKNGADVSEFMETSALVDQVSKIQEELKNLCGALPDAFDEKAFTDEGWEE